MKFSLFVHMERWDESVSHRQLFEDLTELTLMAEAGGFSTVWIGEHHAMEYTISPSPMPLLAYLAAKTTTIHLGAGTIIMARSSPRGLRLAPAGTQAAGKAMWRASGNVTSSCGTTVSSPSGTTAPVMIFTHRPAAMAPCQGLPASARPITSSTRGASLSSCPPSNA